MGHHPLHPPEWAGHRASGPQHRHGEGEQKEYPLFQSDFIEKETYKNHVQKKLTKHVQKIHSSIYSSECTVSYRLGHPSPLPDSALF
jgi:hypothetical protein